MGFIIKISLSKKGKEREEHNLTLTIIGLKNKRKNDLIVKKGFQCTIHLYSYQINTTSDLMYLIKTLLVYEDYQNEQCRNLNIFLLLTVHSTLSSVELTAVTVFSLGVSGTRE